MLAQRQILRAAPRFTAQLRATAQRRLNSTENSFVRERRKAKEHAAGTTGCACIPALALASWNARRLWNEHWEHWEHLPPLEERIEYPYQNIRTKNYSWGNGDRTLFWNDEVNYHNKDKTT
ncbi:hypothetical protein ACRALDRAFT_2097455 [Sodiomyces alcalophilus JCM 7366]|uniref:uncharacterized protein n=1 Tax=Sodiomyces alcalophilus JCM 7366 TaxID=591952 RepID=UPI0039B3DE62